MNVKNVFTTESGIELVYEYIDKPFTKASIEQLYEIYSKYMSDMELTSAELKLIEDIMAAYRPKLSMRKGKTVIELDLAIHELEGISQFFGNCISLLSNQIMMSIDRFVAEHGIWNLIDPISRRKIDKRIAKDRPVEFVPEPLQETPIETK